MKNFWTGDFLPLKKDLVSDPYGYIRDFSLDLVMVLLLEMYTIIFVWTPFLNDSFLRYLLGFLLVMFVPGYAFIAAMFPRKDALPGLERLLFSFTASIAAVPMIGFVLNFTEFGVRLEPLLISIVLFTTACTLFANKRRNDLPPDDRFGTDLQRQIGEAVEYILPSADGFAGKALNIVMVMSIATLCVTTAYVILTSGNQEKFTELYVLGPDGKVGDYPLQFYTGHARAVTVSVINHEQSNMTYDLVALIDDGNNRTPLWQEQLTLGDNQTWEKRIDLMPDVPGDHLKLEFDLFAGGDKTSPYRSVHLWVNVTPVDEEYTNLTVYGFNYSSPSRYLENWDLAVVKGFEVALLNHEYRDVPYLLEVALVNDTSSTVLYNNSLTLAHNATWNKRVLLKPDRLGRNQKLQFSLYVDGNTTAPYRFVEYTTNVTSVSPTPAPAVASSPNLSGR